MDGGIKMAKQIYNIFSSKIKQSEYTFSTPNLCIIRLGAEETLFLVHTGRCLYVFKGEADTNLLDVWIKLEWRNQINHKYLSGDELLSEYTRYTSYFPYRYLAYYYYRAKGWLIISHTSFLSSCTFSCNSYSYFNKDWVQINEFIR